MSVVSHRHPLHSSVTGLGPSWNGGFSFRWCPVASGRGKVTQNQQSVNCGHAIYDTQWRFLFMTKSLSVSLQHRIYKCFYPFLPFPLIRREAPGRGVGEKTWETVLPETLLELGEAPEWEAVLRKELAITWWCLLAGLFTIQSSSYYKRKRCSVHGKCMEETEKETHSQHSWSQS